MTAFLETDRLLLRRLTAADAPALVELDSDPEVMRLLSNGRPTPDRVIREEVLPGLLEDYERFAGLGCWAAVDRATGEFLGWFALRPPQPEDATVVELGYRLRRASWGRGLATEGSRALVAKAFAQLGVQRVFAETMAVNTASRRVLEKAGLRLVRTFHGVWDDPIPGSEHGEVEYELLRAGSTRGGRPPPAQGPGGLSSTVEGVGQAAAVGGSPPAEESPDSAGQDAG